MDNECCANCALCKMLEKYDYSNGGCKHSSYDGYACLAFVNEDIVVHIVGADINTEQCECWSPHKKDLESVRKK